MSRKLRPSLLLVLVLLAAILAVVAQPALPAHAGESGRPTEGNYVGLDQPKRLFTGSLTAQNVTYFNGMGGTTGIPQAGTSGLQLEVTLTSYTTVTSIYLVGKNMDQVPPNFPSSGSTLTAIANKGPIMNSATVSVDDSLATNQLAIWNIQGAAGTSVSVTVDVVGYYTKNNVGGGYVPVNESTLFDTTTANKIPAGGTMTQKVTGGAVPTGATAVYLDLFEYGLTTAQQGSMSAVTYGTSTTNALPVLRVWTGAQGDSDLVVVKLNSDGQITFKNTGTVAAALSARVMGYTTNSPDTGADWQPGIEFVSSQSVPAGGKVDVQVAGYPLPSTGVAGVTLHVKTTDAATGAPYLLMYPTGTAKNGNAVVDRQYSTDTNAVDRRSSVVVVPGVGGKVTVENPSTVDVSVYLQGRGWFAGPTGNAPEGGNSAMSMARTSAGPCFAYLHPTDHNVRAGCTDSFGGTLQWNEALSPVGEKFSGQVQIVSRPGGRAMVVARHAGDGEIWTWDFPAGGFPQADPVRTFRPTETPVLAFNLTNGNPVAITSDSLGKAWALDLNVTAPSAPVWKELVNEGNNQMPTGELSVTTINSKNYLIVGTTPSGEVAHASYLTSTTLSWWSYGGTSAVGRPAVTLNPNHVLTAVQHADGSIWNLGFGGWQKINTTYHGIDLVTVGSPSLVYDPATHLNGVLFRSNAGAFGDDQYVVWETAPESQDFSGPVYNILLTANKTITDAVTYDFRSTYDAQDPSSLKWGFSYLDKTNTPVGNLQPYLFP